MSLRFLHTSDWQLGMTRNFLSAGAQERYAQARFDAVRAMGRVAAAENCRFMLVCGDAFESNQVDRRTVARAMEALKDVPVPVYLLPGNHDPLNAASVYRCDAFVERKPGHVHVVESGCPIRIDEDAELVGAPWISRRPAVNPVEALIENLQPPAGKTRICAAHGMLDRFTPEGDAPGVIAAALLEAAVAEGRIHFAALGDRHSLTPIGSSGRIWYSGTPEATDFSEDRPGCAQIVAIGPQDVTTRPVPIGRWRFVEMRVELAGADDIETLAKSLDAIEGKEVCVLRLKPSGSLTLSAMNRLRRQLENAGDLFGALDVREDRIFIVPDDADFSDFGFTGFADASVKQLRAMVDAGGAQSDLAREALLLMMRLARRTE